MKTKKKKTKKLKSSSSKKLISKIDLRAASEEYWKSPSGISQKASAAGLPDPYAVRINVFEEAAKVKNYKQLERFFELYAPGMDAADVAYAAMKHISSSNKSWSLFKILKDPDYYGEIVTLFNDIEKPKSAAAFQNEIWRFKKELGLARTKTGNYSKAQLEKAAAKNVKKNLILN